MLKMKSKNINYEERFLNYYQRFLEPSQRNLTINCMYEYIILSYYLKNDTKKVSISPLMGLDRELKSTIINMKDEEKLFVKLRERFNKNGYKTKMMYRMTLTDMYEPNEKTMALEYHFDNYFFEQTQINKLLLVKNKDILGYSRITNIDYNGANIIFGTYENYRKCGIATYMLHKMLLYCKEKKYIPILNIDRSNIGAMKVAKSLGLVEKCKEIIVSYGSEF